MFSGDAARTLFEASPDPAFVTSPEGVILGLNSAWERVTGHRAAEWVGKSFRNLVHPEDLEKVSEAFRAAVAGGLPPPYGARYYCGKGQVRRGEFTIAPVREGGRVVSVAGFARDITERMLAEEALQASERRYGDLIDTLPHGVQVNDLSGVITYSNPAHHRMLGYGDGELVGKHIWDVMPEDEAQESLRSYLMYLVGEHPAPTPYVARCVRKDGSPVVLQIDWDYRRDPEGTLSGFTSIITDITERFAGEEELRESRERYRELVEGANSIILRWDTEGRILYMNPFGLGLFGYTEEELVGRSVMGTIVSAHAMDGKDLAAMIRAILENPSAFVKNENENMCKDGSRVWINWTNKAVFDRNGEYIEILSIGNDITERKRVAEALRESEERMRSIVEGAPYGAHMYRLEPDGSLVFTEANAAADRILGVDNSSFVGRKIEDAFPALASSEIPEAYRRVARTGELFEKEEVVYEGGGIRGAFEIRAFQTGERRMAVFFRDITEKKKAENALRESKEKYRAIVENTAEWIWEIDREGRHIYSNRAIRSILGYTPEEILGRNSMDLLHEDDRQAVGKRLSELRAAGQGWAGWILRWRHKDGGYRWLESNASPVLSQDGKVTGFRGSDRDITERKNAEAQRLEMERKLLHTQKLESLGILAGGIAHDFNNLLMAILGNLEIALIQASPGSSARGYVEQAVQATCRAADLTQQMLAYTGRGKTAVRKVSMSDLVDENAHLLRATIPRNVTLNITLEKEPASIEADATQLQQIVMNLITNAAEAIGSAPGVITLSTGKGYFDEAALGRTRIDEIPPAGEYAFLEVADTGRGMDPETEQRLFDPFFTTKELGRGLGLSATQGIVRAHHGAIFIRTAPGSGSSIQVLFPLAGGESRPAVETGGSAVAEVGRLHGTVLVVDDEEFVRRVCGQMAATLGLTVKTAAGGEEALEIVGDRGGAVDCVLLDLSMPGMDGLETFIELRRIRPGIRIVLSSGFHKMEAIGRFPGEIPDDFIQKPYTLEKLRRALTKVLGAAAGGGTPAA